jgi:hypothetical protein
LDRQVGSLVVVSVLKILIIYISTHQYVAAENLLHSLRHRLTDEQFAGVNLRDRAKSGSLGEFREAGGGKGQT